MNQPIAKPSTKPNADFVESPKRAARIVLVPNREILQRRIAEHFNDRPDEAVISEPPVYIFSAWVEDLAVKLRQLAGSEVPRSQDAVTGLLEWSRSGPINFRQAFAWSAARQARAADRLLRQWQEDGEAPWLERGFYARRRQVRAAMQSTNTFGAEDWLVDLARHLARSDELPVALPQAIKLEGFIELTPLERSLLGALEARGVRVERTEPDPSRTEAKLLGFDTPEDEWKAAARWARERVNSGAESVCVVVPANVTTSGAGARRFRQAFYRAFFADTANRFDPTLPSPFFVPSGGRLAGCRAVQDAFMLMTLAVKGAHAPLAFPTISHWLLSPHWAASDSERQGRARLEARLRKRGLYRLSLNQVVHLARVEDLAESLPALRERVEALQAGSHPGSAGEKLHAALGHWGWPGPSGGLTLSRQIDRLQGLLERIAGLPLSSPDEGLGLLNTLCEDTVMPLGGGPLSPVQVLTPDVAAAGRFEALWMCHADDVSWPPPMTVNPYVPGRARKNIPRMNPEGQYHYYRVLTDMLLAAAPQVRVSWSRDAGQGPRNASGLVAGLRPGEKAQAVHDDSRKCATPVAVEVLEDGAGLPFRSEGDVDLPGGADFFRLQAACPLMAYVRYRLGAEFTPMPGPVPDPAFRGVLLHRTLRVLYQGEGDDRGVPDAGSIPEAVSTVLADRAIRARLTPTGLKAEEGRLRQALASWLALDASREGFSVAALEERHELRIGRALVRTRFDRRDRLDDGRVLLIDYKSGNPQKSRALKWLLDRIQEVQLPIYAVGYQAAGLGEIGGLALAAVRPGDCALDGISDHEASAAQGIRIAGKTRGKVGNWQWPALCDHWKAQAQLLSEEILAGRADNRVYDADALRYGELSLILRHELEPEQRLEGGRQ